MSETIISTVRTESPIQSVISPAARIVSEISRASQGPVGPQGPPGVVIETFESVSKNLKSYPWVPTFTGEQLTAMTYNLGEGRTIVKTLVYTGSKLTSIILSGDIPAGINNTKIFTYIGAKIADVSYSNGV